MALFFFFFYTTGNPSPRPQTLLSPQWHSSRFRIPLAGPKCTLGSSEKHMHSTEQVLFFSIYRLTFFLNGFYCSIYLSICRHMNMKTHKHTQMLQNLQNKKQSLLITLRLQILKWIVGWYVYRIIH